MQELGRQCDFFTMMRHPIDRLVSAFYYCPQINDKQVRPRKVSSEPLLSVVWLVWRVRHSEVLTGGGATGLVGCCLGSFPISCP